MADLASSSAAKLAAVSPSATHLIGLHGTRFRSSDELDLPPCVGVVETTTEGDVELPGGVESLRCGSGWSAGPLRRGNRLGQPVHLAGQPGAWTLLCRNARSVKFGVLDR
jgi:hypothetical protein